ncbi:glutamine-synthetase adenylyltransferase [Corynebacterium atypicum]|uniref:Glutamine-synthetase adenylyltransferase n=1 Tax=Corynebacterium atypicum TaxID=191610 RepID=A0ABM5QNZ5_9CORY|nr:bifunctional [glutamine synthetase] adenylyltransferase/[glutamine synthetase]-adenylyl-L-tyrosine phosphorylase [Corynebacterium atypicum]AIG64472.1 glutamine-synthetase adenylyltransferase [Corynebacterium atypicum]
MTPHTFASDVPTPAVLGLTGPRASDDLSWLGWDTPSSTDVLWALAGCGDADLALNTAVRLVAASAEQESEAAGEGESAGQDAAQCAAARRLRDALQQSTELRVRFFALLGGSAALGDYVVAHAAQWKELLCELPTQAEMMQVLLGAVEATPAEFAVPPEPADPACAQADRAGTYRAQVTGPEAVRRLKEAYRGLLVRIAAFDLAGTYPSTKRHPGGEPLAYEEVVELLTQLADAALTAALAVGVAEVYKNAPLDGQLAVMALGKCGARELNYISDVDVVFVGSEASPKLTRLAGEFARIGTKCFFDVDANLRPEGRSGALVRTVASHVTYYRRWAQTWEFQALLKARAQTGYLPLGRDYLDQITPMVWQASQREEFVGDVQAMRARVVESVPAELKDRELKLGRGGLRDVEFAIQLLQMVHGRSDESLRETDTVAALKALIAGGYVGRDDGFSLISAYAFLRTLEHRLQLHRLKRTHSLPAAEDSHAWQWLARTAGFSPDAAGSSTDKLQVELKRVRRHVHQLHSKLFYRPLLQSVAAMSVDALKLSPQAAKLQLGALGYRHPSRAFEHLQALAAGSTRKAKIQALLLPTLMDWLGDTADPDLGLLNYRKLSEAAYHLRWFLRLLRDEGVVGQRLMHILGTSVFTAQLIIANPDFVRMLGDSATGPKLLDTSSQVVARSLVTATKRHDDPDRAIAVARSLRRTELARITSADLLGLMTVPEVCRALSAVWEAVLDAAIRAEVRFWLSEENLDRPPARIAVISMGRLGGAELGYGSDADVLFVAQPAAGVTDADAVSWAIKVCDSMRARLAKPSQDPPLEVDLGLRPEGRSGPTVRTVESYRRYYRQWGEVWETVALLRAAPVGGDPEVAEEFLAAIDPVRYPPGGVTEATLREVRRMKARIDTERLPRGADRNTHTKLGRGGLTDVEWTVQLLILEHAHECERLHNTSTLEALEVLAEESILDSGDAEVLRDAWLAATHARNALVLAKGKRVDQLPQPGPQLVNVAAAAGWAPADYQEFLEDYLRRTRRARRVVDRVFWGESTLEP